MKSVKEEIVWTTRVCVRRRTPYLNTYYLLAMPVLGPEHEVYSHLRDLDKRTIFPENRRMIEENWWPLP